MNKNRALQRGASLFLLTIIFISLLVPVFSIGAFADGEVTGLSPKADGRVKYEVSRLIEKMPNTFEATVKVPTTHSDSYSFISSYVDRTRCDFIVGIGKSGNPYVTVYKNVEEYTSVVFQEIDVRTNEWTHIAITVDEENSTTHCYINGELKETKSIDFPEVVLENKIIIGGSYGYKSNFPASIMNVALYSDVRTATEIASDYSTAPSGDNLLGYYDFSSYNKTNPQSKIEDLSSSDNDLVRFYELYDEPVKELGEYAYSFALVGDPQVININYPHNMNKPFEWIRDNAEQKKIAFAFNLGDITDKDTDEEWARADEAFHLLDGAVPYSVIRGNHDKSVAKYNEVFDYESHKHMIAGSYDGTMLNTYQTFEVCGNKYLVLNLDFKMQKDVVDWANEIVAKYHDRNVIITTHIYLASDGTTLDTQNDGLSADKYGAVYDGEGLWKNLISKHKNISMVFAGHITSTTILTTQRVGIHGNTVTQILVDPQGLDGVYGPDGLGMVAMLYFTEDGKIANTQFYSTIQDKYFVYPNEYTIEFDPIQSNGSVPNNHSFSVLDYDDEKHWFNCACGELGEISEHVYGEWIVTREPTEQKRGTRYAVCVCGDKKIENFEYEPPIEEPKERNPVVVTIILIVGIAVIVGGGIGGAFIFLKKKDTPVDKENETTADNE